MITIIGGCALCDRCRGVYHEYHEEAGQYVREYGPLALLEHIRWRAGLPSYIQRRRPRQSRLIGPREVITG